MAGRGGRPWARLKANLRAQHRPCWICGQPINYAAAYDAPDAFEVDHIKSWSAYPELREDPGNLAASHKRCNGNRGADAPPPAIGITSRRW